MAQEQKTSAPLGLDQSLDVLATASFDRSVQEAREFDYNLNTKGVEADRNPVTNALNLSRDYMTTTQSYLVGVGEGSKFEQFSSEVHQMAFDLTTRMVMELKNSFTSQVPTTSPSTNDLYFQYDVIANANSANPCDRGFAKGSAIEAIGRADTSEHDREILAKVVPASQANLERIFNARNNYIDSYLQVAA